MGRFTPMHVRAGDLYSPFERVLARLPEARPVNRAQTEWRSPCPAHADSKPSLYVTAGDDGRALIHCYGGCPPEAIVAALDLTMADLMPNAGNAKSGIPGPAARHGSYAGPTAAHTPGFETLSALPQSPPAPTADLSSSASCTADPAALSSDSNCTPELTPTCPAAPAPGCAPEASPACPPGLSSGSNRTPESAGAHSAASAGPGSASGPGPVYPTAAAAVAELERRYGPCDALWPYNDIDNEPVGAIVRWDRPDGKMIRPISRRDQGWVIGGMPEPRPLYRLADLYGRPHERVYVTEGEKAAQAGESIGLLTTTSPHGSGSAGKADWTPLAGRDVAILPDNDEAGRRYAGDVAKILAVLTPASTVRIVALPDLPPHGDLYDWLQDRDATESEPLRERLNALAEAAPVWSMPAVTSSAGNLPARTSEETPCSVTTNGIPTPASDTAVGSVPAGASLVGAAPAEASEETPPGVITNGAPAATSNEPSGGVGTNTTSCLHSIFGDAVPYQRPVVRCLGDMTAKPVRWLWPQWMAFGRITIVVGRPGTGKSFLTTDLAARITTGRPWPDGSPGCAPGSVLMITAEDGPEEVLIPRCAANGADVPRVHTIEMVHHGETGQTSYEALFTLADVIALEQALQGLPDCRLVVVDPVGSFLGDRTDSYRDSDVRALLAPVQKLAEVYGPAILLVAHPRKSAGVTADDQAMGSRGFVGIARNVWHLLRDRDDDDRRLLLSGKSNLGPTPAGRAFTIAGDPPALQWEAAPVDISADEAVRAENNGSGAGQGHSALGEAVAWLQDVLADGPVPSKELFRLAKEEGIAPRTLRRAGAKLGIEPDQAKGERAKGWSWQLPGTPAREGEREPLLLG